uniref:Protein SOGA3-like n=1 Tax=Phallusia mammillata TaxID=59560 RepID=A0A6F9DSQ5_9ASCI|nr:protein SOGA3-like [Phallusia mammillata]
MLSNVTRVCRCPPHNCRCGMTTIFPAKNHSDVIKDGDVDVYVDSHQITDLNDVRVPDSPKHTNGSSQTTTSVKYKQDGSRNKQRNQQTDPLKRALIPPANQTGIGKSKQTGGGGVREGVGREGGGGARVTFLETPTLHVLQPHSHKRHFSHHLLDHFSSNELLRRSEKKRPHQRQKWQELTPVSTSCEYKDSNFLSEGTPSSLIVVKQHLEPSLSMSDGEVLQTTKSHPPLKSTNWRRTPVLYGDKKANKKYYSFQYESVDGPTTRFEDKFQKTRGAGRGHHSDVTNKTRLQQSRNKYGASYLGKQGRADEVSELDSGVVMRSGRGGMQKNKLRRCKSLKDSTVVDYLHSRAVQTDLSSFVQLDLQHAASQTDTKRLEFGELFQFDKSELSDSSVTTTSFVDSSLSSTPTEEYADDKSSLTYDEEFAKELNSDLTPNSYFRFHLQARSKHIHNRLRRMREHLSSQHKSRVDVNNATITLLNDLEQVVFEAYELYDDFDCDMNKDSDKLQEMRKELQATKRNCRILEYELMRSDVISADNERVAELEEETKLCRHVAVSLHWELQAADEKLQKTENENNDLREKMLTAEVEKDIYEKEVLSLRNMVDQMSLHASSVPAEPEPPSSTHRQTIPELQRQVRFYDEERKAVLTRLVEVEKERDSILEMNDNYRRIYGEILLPLRSLESEEWRTKDLKIRIRMAEDQAGVLGRRVMQLEMENGNLLKQVEDWETTNAEQSKKATTSDVQFLEDEVEALRLALQEAEEENLVLRDQLGHMNRMAKEREKKLLLEVPKLDEKIIPKSPIPEKAPATPSEVVQPWSLPDSKSVRVNRSDSDMTLSVMNPSDLDKYSMRVMTHIRTAIDAETQTIENMQVSDVIERILGDSDIRKPQRISKELIDVLTRSKEADVTRVVEQLHNLAVATHSLLGDCDVTDVRRVVTDDKATQKTEGSLVHYHVTTEEVRRSLPPPRVEVITVEKEQPRRVLNTSQLLVLTLLSYVTATSLPFSTLLKLIFLVALFFLF